MARSFMFLLILIASVKVSYGQFLFKDDQTNARIQSGAMDDIDKKFQLEKDNDFELRLFIFPKETDPYWDLSIIIIAYKNGKWSARLFQDAWSVKNSRETPVKNDGLDSLWKGLNENDVLTIPNAQYLVDKDGNIIIEQLESDNHSMLYTFELLSKDAYRSYAYKCPFEFSKKYNYVPTFTKVARIVQLILKCCEMDSKMICSANLPTYVWI